VNLLSVRATNFMSFKEFDFIYPASGLFFVGGKVLGSSVSTSNRAGKSVFASEAISWCLFGKTVRGISGDEVVNKTEGKNCFVEVILEDDKGVSYVVHRYRKHSEEGNSFKLYRETEDITRGDVYKTQDLLNQILGMNWLTFSTVVVFGEKARRFIEAGDKEKKEIFDEIMMFQQYQEAYKKVKEDLSRLADDKKRKCEHLGRAEAVISEVEQEQIEQEKALEQIREQRGDLDKVIEQKRKQISDKKAILDKASEEIQASEKALKKLEEEQKRLEIYEKDFISEIEEKLSEASKSVRAVRDVHVRVSYELSEVEKWFKNKDALVKGTRCKVCGSEITDKSVEEGSRYYEQKRQELEKQKQELDEKLKEASKAEQEIREDFENRKAEILQAKRELSEEIAKYQTAIRDGTTTAAKIESEITVIEKEIEYLEKEYEEKEKVLLQSLVKIKDKLNKYKGEIAKLEDEIEAFSDKENYLKFWLEGFSDKGIKSLLLDEILPQLNSLARYYSATLMDDEIMIEFDTETMLKSGEKRDKFDIKLLVGGEEVKYESCSAGEKRRIDVSVLLSLQSLMSRRAVSTFDFVVFDEVFDSLDSVGIERVIRLLEEEARNKVVFVISHIDSLKDYFDNVILIEKREGISYLSFDEDRV